MKKNVITVAIVIAILAGLTFVNRLEPERNESDLLEQQIEAAEQIEKAEKAEMEAKAKAIEEAEKAALENAPVEVEAISTEPIRVKFAMSTGDVLIELYPEWSPLGVAQFVKALESGVFDESRFYRALPEFIVQFGIPANPELTAYWLMKNIKAEPVKTTNARGTVTYAKLMTNPDSRTTELFINIGDNGRLDELGFPPIGKVIEGMEFVDKIYMGYTDEPDASRIERIGNAYLKENFPKLDYIKKATIVD